MASCGGSHGTVHCRPERWVERENYSQLGSVRVHSLELLHHDARAARSGAVGEATSPAGVVVITRREEALAVHVGFMSDGECRVPAPELVGVYGCGREGHGGSLKQGIGGLVRRNRRCPGECECSDGSRAGDGEMYKWGLVDHTRWFQACLVGVWFLGPSAKMLSWFLRVI